MRWRIYKVGERKNGDFKLTGAYKSYPVNLRNMTAENVAGAAKAMESFVIGSQMQCLSESYTDEAGTVDFSGLDAGLYFAVAKSVKEGVFMRKADPIFFEVTNTEYESTLFPKVYSTATLSDEITNLTVKKVWVDNDNAYVSRPVDITVDIYKDEEYVETVLLSEKNNWTYNWITDEPDAEWRVVERYIPRKYEVYINYNTTQYLIKNTYVPEIITDGDDYYITTGKPLTTTSTTFTTTAITETTTSENESSVTASSPSSTTDVAGGTATASASTSTTDVAGGTASQTTSSGIVSTPNDSNSAGNPKLPQTGQLWWPIPFLLGGGFLMLGTAAAITPKKPKRE
jgi:hypothetical protein